jgi:hypothetical protein
VPARVLAEEQWLDAVQALDRLDPSALVMIDATLHHLDTAQPP